MAASPQATGSPHPAKAVGAGARRRGLVPAPMLVLVSVLCVQFGQAFGRQLFDDAGPLGVASLRLSMAALVLMLLWRPRLPCGSGRLGTVPAFGTAIAGMSLVYPALQYLPLGVATALQLLGPLTVALLASRRLPDLLWALLATTGVLLFYVPGARPQSATGVCLAIASGVAMGSYLLLSRRAGRRATDGSLLAWAVSWAALLSLPFGIAESGTRLLEPHLLLAGIGVAVLSAVLPYSLDLSALRHLPPRMVGTLESLEPAVAALAGILVLGQGLAINQWLALACITIACAGTMTVRPPNPR
jgi:threonine/homoserine efflux transporter RhtA